MITIKKDSELITNYVTASPVPAGEEFGVFVDKNQQPAVLALSEDSFLYLIIAYKGKIIRLDFGRSSGIVQGDNAKVQAFAVQQAPDGALDICIAVEASEKESDFYLLYNIKPDELFQPIPEEKLIRGRFPTVDHFYMRGKSTDMSRSLPLVMVAFTKADRLTKTEDLNFVEYDGRTATLNGEWNLPTDPEIITAVELGTTPLGDGAFILYKGQSRSMFLLFQLFTGSTKFSVQPHCPDGATALSTFIDPEKQYTVLLVAGKEITYFVPKDYFSSTGKGTVMDTLDKISGLKDLHTSQAGDNLRLWYTTTDDAVHYYTTTTSTLSGGTIIPLLPEKQGGRVSGLLSAKPVQDQGDDLLVSSLLSVDENGNLSLLQQDSVSKVWQQYPFWHASEKNVMEVKGYMLRMHATLVNEDPNGGGDGADLIPGCWLCVSSSGVVRCIINGKHATLSPTAQWYQTDAKGVLNILLQTEDATCHRFAAERFKPVQKDADGERVLDDTLLDPSVKVVGRLNKIQSEEELRNLRRPDGSPVIGPDVPDDDVKAAAKAFKDLSDRSKDIHENGKQWQATYVAAASKAMDYGDIAPLGFWGDIADDIAGAWHWVEDKVEEAWDWGCKLVGGVWKFIVKIGEEVFEIALTTITSIVKGIVWVFKKIGAFIEDIIQFLGFLFDWGDILDTADGVVSGFNAALDYGQVLLNKEEVNFNQWLEDLRTTLKEQLPRLQDHDYTQGSSSREAGLPSIQSSQTANKGSSDQPSEDDVKAGVAYNWSAYYFTYGGGTTNAVLHDDSLATVGSSGDQLLNLWDGILDELQDITGTVVKIAKDFVEFFVPGNYSVNKLINKIGTDLIDGLIDSLKKLADILVKAITSGIDIMKEAANREIDIPVISWLWKNIIAKGRPLTLLNFCALLIAIPTTVLYKATTQRAPPKLASRLNKDTFSQYVTGQADASLSSDIASFGLAASSGTELLADQFDTIALVADGTFEGLGLEAIPIGIISDLMNVLDTTTLTFESVNGFLEWPVVPPKQKTAVMEAEAFDLKTFVKYSKWGIKVASWGSSVVIKVVAKAKKAERPVIKRWKGTVGAVLSVPKLCLALCEGIEDADEGEKETILIVNEFLEGGFAFGKQWGTSVAQWNNELENELMYIGLAVKQACAIAYYGLKLVDFVEGHA